MSTPHEKALEAATKHVANALKDDIYSGNPIWPAEKQWQVVVEAYLTNLEEKGWKVVPVEPTDAMIEASRIPSASAGAFFSSMINAAPKVTE